LSPIASFGEKLEADYAVMTAEFSPEELLFLLVNPPDIPYQEGDFIQISVGGARRNTKNFIFSVVNNIVNRVLANAEYDLTYRDTVYIDMALRKLGVENIALFMERARMLRDENLSVYRLTEIYRDNIETLKETLTRDAQRARVGTARLREDESAAAGKNASFYLHSEIFKRLDTANIVNALARFAQSSSETRTRLHEREMLISEQQRTAMTLRLSEYRRELPAFGDEDVYYSRNHYETDDVRNAPADEKSIMGRALTASLLQLIDNVTTSRAKYYLSRRNIWVDITEALHVSARNSAERFLSFRASAFADMSARGEPVDLGTLALLAKKETEILTDYIESERVHVLRADAETAAPAEADEGSEWAERGAREEDVLRARDAARAVLLELARVHVARLRAAEAQTPRGRISADAKAETAPPAESAAGSSFFADVERSGEAAREEQGSEETLVLRETVVREEAARGATAPADDARRARDAAHKVSLESARASGARLRAEEAQTPRIHESADARAEDAPPAKRPADSSLFADVERNHETVREEPGSEETLILRETTVREEAARSAAPPAGDATLKARDAAAGAPETAGPEAALTRIIDSGARARQKAGIETTYYETERETYEITQLAGTRAPGAAEGAEQIRADGAPGAAEDGTLRETILREALDRINTENNERLEHLKELRAESEKVPIATRPDRQRIMRDALQAIEDPLRVIREISEREESASREEAGREEELLLHTDETSRKILESLRLLQDDPAAAAAAGIRVADGPGPLISEIALVERERAENARADAEQRRAALFDEASEQAVKQLIYAEPALAETGAETRAWDRSPPIVHRRPDAAPDIEEILRRREQRVVSEHTGRNEETTETSIRTSEVRTQNSISGSRGDAIAGSAEDIAEMINATLMRRIGVITDRVYGQLEKKLKSEKSRRGGL
jgi:hypothetical protein